MLSLHLVMRPTTGICCVAAAAVETLEARRLLVAAEAMAPLAAQPAEVSPPPLVLRVNFQPEDSTNVPRFHRADIGRPYGTRANKFTYGWNTSNEDSARQRLSDNAPDFKHDTLNHFRSGSATWEVAVPNGTYVVKILAGDPRYTDSIYRIDVEGMLTVDGVPTREEPWVTGSALVQVSDGRLTVSNAPGARNNKICSIEIHGTNQPSSGNVNLVVDEQIDWHYSSIQAPFSRVEPGVIRLDDKVYVMGGYTNGYRDVTQRVDILDIETGTWTRGADLPGTQTHAGVATDGRFIYWVSGQDGPAFSTKTTPKAWKYDPEKDRWHDYIDLPEARFGGAMAYHDNALHFFGGTKPDRNTAVSDHWILRFEGDGSHWVPGPPIPEPADHLGHAVVDGKIYLIGGEHDHGNEYIQHGELYRYDPAAQSWTRLADMPTASSHFEGNVVEAFGKIFVLAGQVDGELLTNEVRSYDPARDRWTVHTPMPEMRKGGVSWEHDGKLYYTNGDSYKNGQPRSTIVGELTPHPVASSSVSLAASTRPPPSLFSTIMIRTDRSLIEELELI